MECSDTHGAHTLPKAQGQSWKGGWKRYKRQRSESTGVEGVAPAVLRNAQQVRLPTLDLHTIKPVSILAWGRSEPPLLRVYGKLMASGREFSLIV